jgi:hypothetical protein
MFGRVLITKYVHRDLPTLMTDNGRPYMRTDPVNTVRIFRTTPPSARWGQNTAYDILMVTLGDDRRIKEGKTYNRKSIGLFEALCSVTKLLDRPLRFAIILNH